jgi:hypothetical protein
MQLGKKSRKGRRCIMRTDATLIVNKRGKVEVVLGSNIDESHKLRTGTPSTFNQLGKAL